MTTKSKREEIQSSPALQGEFKNFLLQAERIGAWELYEEVVHEIIGSLPVVSPNIAEVAIYKLGQHDLKNKLKQAFYDALQLSDNDAYQRLLKEEENL